MKKLILIVISLLILTPSFASAQNLQNFSIASFEADYHLSKDEDGVSQLKVEETIVAWFPNFNQNRGIERALPQTYRGHRLNLKVESVSKSDGSAWRYTTRQSSGNVVLRVGDPNRYVQGRQTYRIVYTMRDVITFEDSKGDVYQHDEWYWNINGTQWRQPFGSVTARVHLSSDLSDKVLIDKQQCWTGVQGSSQSNCSIETDDNGQITISSKGALASSENVSFALAFKRGSFSPYQPHPLALPTALSIALLAGVIVPLLYLLVVYLRWRRHGRDPAGRGVIIPQYQPPKLSSVIEAGVVLKEKMETGHISAVIIDLCVRGYLKIYEKEKKQLLSKKSSYELEVIKQTSDLSEIDQAVISALFGSSPEVGKKIDLSSLSNKLETEVAVISDKAKAAVTDHGYFAANPRKVRNSSIGKNIAAAFGIGLLLAAAGVSISLLLNAAVFQGDLSVYWPLTIISLVFGFVVMLVSGIIAGYAMPRRTDKGVEEKDYLLGLEQYMNLAEKDRIAFLQSVKGAERINTDDNRQLIKLYEKLLPYAMLFGIDKSWAEQFAKLYSPGQSPTWYSGHSAFNAVVFSHALSGVSTAAVSSFSAPASSGSSGFSGGGFSGGGGGGGGGGGW